jgi:signal transduction histidine kinase
VNADEIALREAVRNLIDNAIKHTPAGTSIRVEATQTASIIVEDTGPGLGALNAEEVQMPFRKGSTTSDGAGLGLAIVRQAAELHGGHLEISKSPLGGARFAIHLPHSG